VTAEEAMHPREFADRLNSTELLAVDAVDAALQTVLALD